MKIPSDVHYPGRIDSVVAYGLVNASELEDEARKRATEDAKKRAEKTAALVGRKVGKVVSIDCSSSWPYRVIIDSEQHDFPIQHVGTNPETIEITRSMTITFELLDQ